MSAAALFSLVLFVLTYVLMFTLQRIRPWVSLASAVIFVSVGSLGLIPGFSYTLPDALREVDWNVLLMITGIMGSVFLFIASKMPMRMSEWILSHVRSARTAMVLMVMLAGIVSAFIDNVATVLMLAPVALAMCQKLDVSPVAPIVCLSLSSNLQGAATLVGDTTSILLARQAGMDFMDFFFMDGRPGMFFVTEAGAVMTVFLLLWIFRDLKAEVHVDGQTEVTDLVPTFLLLGTILSLIAVSFIPYASTAEPGQLSKPELTNGLICIGFFVVGLVHQTVTQRSRDPLRRAVGEIDFLTLLLLAGLFIVIGGVERAGVIDLLARGIASIGGSGAGAVFIIYSLIVWISVACSAFIDNIPYTAAMLPVVAELTTALSALTGAALRPELFYFGLLAGATLGGNLTPIGASANITGLGLLRRAGYEVETGTFMRLSVPFTLIAVVTGYALIWLIWS